jgi:hypothetical protein
MSARRDAAVLLFTALALLGGNCGGGDGGGGGGSTKVKVESPDDRCAALGSPFPPGFDLVPGTARAWAADLSPPALVPFDVDGSPPEIGAHPGVFGLPFDSDGDGREEGSPTLPLAPILDDVHVVSPDLALVTASSYEEVLFFDPGAGDLVEVEVSVPAGFAPGDYPLLPAPGAPAEPRTAISTFACVRPPPGALDSLGDPISQSVPQAGWCDGVEPSYLASFTSGAALAADHLFVSASNLGSGAGTANPQYLPGAVLVYDLDRGASPPTVRPSPLAPVILTTGFNPTHVTAATVGDREYALVTVSGALGIEPDDPDTPEIEAYGVARTDAAIDVIDAESLELVATIPLGPAGLAASGLRVDPGGRLGVVGSAIGRNLFVVDLMPLVDLPDPMGDPFVLDGSDGDDAVVFDAADPLAIPARPNGAPAASCPGFTAGVDFAASRIFATEWCDGTLALVDVDFAGMPPAPFPTDRIGVAEVLEIAAPLRANTAGEARTPGAVAAYGGPGADGPDVIFLIGQPEGALCGIDID